VRRDIGVMSIVASAVTGAIGALWALFAIIGTEWDYCPRGSDCIPGELVGAAIVATAAGFAWVGVRLVARR
jgi:hypothetical protein